MAIELRKTGISIIGEVPWGTHICHFYETKQDLLDTLVAYLKTGLENKEYCLWIVSDSELIPMEEAKAALAQAVPDLDQQLAAGNIEILSGHDWYFEKNVINLERVLNALVAKTKQALARGFDGMRASADMFWLANKDLKDFCHYEKKIDNWIIDQAMTALCTYPLAKSGAAEILDVMQVHQFATARRRGEWQIVQTSELIQAKAEIKRLNEQLRQVKERTPKPPLILRYGVAVLSVAVALIIAQFLNTNLVSAPGMLFLCALMFSAWYGGLRPSLLALALSLVAFKYYFMTPIHSLSVEAREIPRLLIFSVLSSFVVALSAAQRIAAESLRRARDVLDGTVQQLKRTNETLRAEIAERKRAEALLHAKEQEFRAIVENAPDQIIRYDREFRRAYVNPAVARAYGLPREALVGKSIGSVIKDAGLIVKEDELTQLRQRIANVFDSGQSYAYELNWPLPKGRRYFSVRLFPELDLNGSVVNVLGISRDITERKQAEEALDERLRFETLVTELSAAFANLPPNEVDREIDKWLKTLAEFLGVDRASFLQFGEDWTTVYRSHSYTVREIEPLPPPPIGLNDQFPWITNQLRRGVTVKWSRIPDDMPEEAVKEREYAARLGVKSGLNIPVRLGGSVICAITFTSIAAYRDWPEALVARLRLVGEIFAAAVERKRVEALLKKEKELLEKIFDNIPVMIGFVDDDGVRLVNPEWERTIGWTLKELREQNLDIFVEAYPDPPYRQAVMDFVAAAKGEWLDLKIRVRDGRVIDAACAVVQLSDGTRVAIAQDITERKAAEERLKANSEQLRALSARLQSAREQEGTRIAREIHDEVGGVLTSLKWDLEETDKILAGPIEPSQLTALREKLHALMKLADSAFSAIRRIASELRPTILDDLGLLAAIEWQAQQFQARTGIVCDFECSLEKVELNDEQSTAVFRIFQEALTNILRHAQATRVDIKINEEKSHFVLSVSDNGKGIINGEKFDQQSLGILGMRERAHLIGGEIEIKGEKGKGTVVVVRVPFSGRDRVLKTTR